jgi:hypothetical protein
VTEVTRAKEGIWGEKKETDALMMTPSGRQILKDKSQSSGLTKSEFVERIIRVIPEELVKEFDPEVIAELTQEECITFFWSAVRNADRR